MWPEFGIKISHGSFYLETNIYQNSPKKLSNVCATLVRIIIDKNIQNGHTAWRYTTRVEDTRIIQDLFESTTIRDQVDQMDLLDQLLMLENFFWRNSGKSR